MKNPTNHRGANGKGDFLAGIIVLLIAIAWLNVVLSSPSIL